MLSINSRKCHISPLNSRKRFIERFLNNSLSIEDIHHINSLTFSIFLQSLGIQANNKTQSQEEIDLMNQLGVYTS